MSTKHLHRGWHLQHVPRWTTLKGVNPQSVAEHSYRVAVVTQWLAEGAVSFNTEQAASALRYALNHDMDEAVYSDIPAPLRGTKVAAKDEVSGVSLVASSYVRGVVKCADLLEAIGHLLESNYHDDSVILDLTMEFEANWQDLGDKARYPSSHVLRQFEKMVVGPDPIVQWLREKDA